MDGGKISIQLNGTARELDAGATVHQLVADLGFAGTPVLVEHNGTALYPRDFPATALQDGDRVELIRIVAGG